MISTIEIHGPATFTSLARLTTDKKVNLIYGLNGTGKSTICRFLRTPNLSEFDQCRVQPSISAAVYVYNDDFIRETFYEPETLKGIFSLSKENKEAELRIAAAKREKTELTSSKQQAEAKKSAKTTALHRSKQLAEDASWEIKTSFAGGDRVLEYCLEGFKAKKEVLLNHLLTTPKPTAKPSTDADQLKIEVQALSGQDAQPATKIEMIALNAGAIESDAVFETPVIGSQHSIVSALIQKLGNSDWVREGLAYAENPAKPLEVCPFCQSDTITKDLLSQIGDFFDESYEKAVGRVRSHLDAYERFLDSTPQTSELKVNPFATDRLLLLVEQLRDLMKSNLRMIENKSQSPSSEVVLSDSSPIVSEINSEIEKINDKINSHNEKLRDKDRALRNIRSAFWELMRWEFDHVITRYLEDKKEISSALDAVQTEIREIDDLIQKADLEIAAAQKETINIDQAIESINNALLELGIDDFSISKHDENMYRIKRTNQSGSNKFSTLSEGEKMIITLLYFCELCKGRRSATDTTDEKIVVFDDPVSSLSHIYLFNVGQLLRSVFFKTDLANQVFVFTHSLYFFYELADPKHDRREEQQALFRITKNKGQSHISKMKYDEIQNDYQAYWQVVNDKEQHPALIANCMRNIIDYFFNFVAKLDFNNVFQQPTLKANKFQSFSRFMNRESHSLGQNLYDLKEFDHEIFKEGLRLVFEDTGYGDHYRKMSKI